MTEQYLVERIFLECANAVFLFEIEMFKNTEVNLRNIYFWAGTAMCFKDSWVLSLNIWERKVKVTASHKQNNHPPQNKLSTFKSVWPPLESLQQTIQYPPWPSSHCLLSKEPRIRKAEIKKPQLCDNYCWPQQQTLSCSDFRRRVIFNVMFVHQKFLDFRSFLNLNTLHST